MNILVAAGPTREYFDSVRFISNPSSGRMGYALAREAVRRGHRVTLVTGPVAIRPPKGVTVIPVVSAAQMARACKQAFRQADATFMTAAVCDYRPARRDRHKIEKKARPWRLLLEPTEDIAAALGRRKGKRLLIAFAMQDRDPRRLAERKLYDKRCDLIVLNGPENIGSHQAVVELFTPAQGWSRPIRGTKTAVARQLVRLVESMRSGLPDPRRDRPLRSSA